MPARSSRSRRRRLLLAEERKFVPCKDRLGVCCRCRRVRSFRALQCRKVPDRKPLAQGRASPMSITHIAHCRHFALSLIFLTFASTALAKAPASDARSATDTTTTTGSAKPQAAVVTQPVAAAPSSNSELTYPQIVRISLLQGDVRIARGEKNAGWEQATSDLPLESGFNLVTGNDGRVEIEFEDASTVYLGENSVLSFNDLSTTAGVPATDMTLLSGTLSLRLKPTMPNEWYVVRTPTDHFAVYYPNHPWARIN